MSSSQKKKGPKFSLLGLEQKASELEHKQAMSPTAKCSAEAHQTSGDEEEGTGPQEETTSAGNSPQDAGNSPQDAGMLEEKEKCEGSTDEVKDWSLHMQEMPAITEEDYNSKEQMDESEGAGTTEDQCSHEQPTTVTSFTKQDEDLENGLAALSLSDADPRLGSIGKCQTSCNQESSPDKGEQTLEAASSVHSHPQLLNSVLNPFSIEACLRSFCLPEVLEGEDKIYCQECTTKLQKSCATSTEHSPNLEASLSDNRCSKLDTTDHQAVNKEDQTSQGCEKHDNCESGSTECDCKCDKRDPHDRERVNLPGDVKPACGEEITQKSNDIVESARCLETNSHDSESLVQHSEDLPHSSGAEKDDDCGVNDLDSELCVCLLQRSQENQSVLSFDVMLLPRFMSRSV